MLAVAVMIVMAAAVPVSADGSTGSITITNAKGNTEYKAYKIFDATASGTAVAYTTDANGKALIENDGDAPFTVDSNNYVTLKSGKTTKDVVAWLSENYSSFNAGSYNGTFTASAEDSNSGTYEISNLPSGYYYISTDGGTAISIDSVTGMNQPITIKGTDGPNTPKKEIVGGTTLTTNDAKVGATETFSVTYNATNYAKTTKITNFYIKDTPEGLAIDIDTLKVKVKNDELNAAENEYTANVDNGTLTIGIPWVDANGESLYTPEDTNNPNYGNIPVTVTYDATVTEDAAINVAENEVHIYYNHNTATETEVTDGDIPKTQTYTYKFQLNKVNDEGTALKGAEFELCDSENNKVKLIENGTTYRVAKTGETGTTTTIDMTTNTTVEILGLDNDTYTLTETKAPDGYTLASDTIILAADSDESGNKLVRVNGTYGDNGGDAGNVTVVNRAGSLLPSTGGIGTTIFYVLGALLIIGAGVVLIARRRMNSNE